MTASAKRGAPIRTWPRMTFVERLAFSVSDSHDPLDGVLPAAIEDLRILGLALETPDVHESVPEITGALLRVTQRLEAADDERRRRARARSPVVPGRSRRP